MEATELRSIANKCKVDDEKADTAKIVNRLIGLEQKYPQEELVELYNYFLTIVQNPEVLMNIIRLLDKHRFESTLSPLVDLLLMKEKSDKEAFINVRVMCAKAIANLKNTNAVVPLLYCLNNREENYKIRLACADALGKIGDKYAVAPLIDLVSDEDEKSVYLRESAASALGMLGDNSAVDPLVSILETKKGIIDKFTFLKERVIEALSKLNPSSDRVFKAMKESLQDESPQIRINAIEAIMNSDDERACDLIKPCLSDGDDEVKKNALIALYNLLGVDILDEIRNSIDYSGYLKAEAQKLYDEYEVEDEQE